MVGGTVLSHAAASAQRPLIDVVRDDGRTSASQRRGDKNVVEEDAGRMHVVHVVVELGREGHLVRHAQNRMTEQGVKKKKKKKKKVNNAIAYSISVR